MSSAIAFEHVDVIFGREAQAALAMLDAGEGRDAIFQKTNALVAVHDATLAIEPGEICVLMGLSGSGKSSLLRCVNGLNRASRGRVLVHDGESEVDIASCDSATLRRLRMRRISMVFQQFALMPWRTIRENVGFGLEVRGAPKAETGRVVDEKLKLVRLEQWADKYPYELSGGMQQRVGLARAFATDADILLMDEPFSALDPLIREHLQDELLELQRSLQKTIVFVSHDLDEALKIGSRIAIMEAGRIVQQGPPEEIVTRPASDYVRQFVASMNPLNVLKANSLMRPIAELWRDPADGALLLDRQGRARIRMDGAGRLASIRVDGSEARILPYQEDLEVDRLPPATLVAIPPDATMRTAILARGLAGRPLLVVEGEGAILGVIDEAEIYRGMLREAAAQTPQHDADAPQPAAAQA
ncbi:MAG TPA: choline ABC transporter ATP-binding protein [Alphaproteobacteria bacterium]